MKLPKYPDKKFNIRHFHYLYASSALKDRTGSVLDVGCGNGEITYTLSKVNKKLIVQGCDIDTRVRSKFPIVYTDVCKMPFGDSKFDNTLMFDVLEHVRNPKKAISEVKRVLVNGGMFHLVIPCEADLATIDGWVKLIFKANLKEKPIGHINQFKHKEIIDLLKRSSFEIRTVYYSYHFVYQLLSFFYYFYLHIFNSGNYFTIGKSESGFRSRLTRNVMLLGLVIIYFESKLFKNFKGQTAHITCFLRK
jgi:SAM-dependent methyltransferase